MSPRLFLSIFLLCELEVLLVNSYNDSKKENLLASEETTSSSLYSDDNQCLLNSCPHGPLPCSDEESDACPPGLFCKGGHCECGVYPNNYIQCDNSSHTSMVLRSFCVNFDEQRNLTLVGDCLRVIDRENKPGVDYASYVLYHQLPRSVHQLNEEMCQSLSRTGALCGSCQDGYYPLAYSFNWTCIQCPNIGLNWFKYVMAAYLPLTLFYILILFFKINATSSHLFAVVFFCQNMTVPFLVRSALLKIASDVKASYYLVATKVIFSLYGIVNLDFFRPFYSDLCLGIGILPTLALDYVIGLYPLLLMIISYLLITLYEKNYRVVTLMWSPFRSLLSLFRRNWDVRTSVIDAYATMFFLSNVKFLSVSFDLLTPIQVYQLYPDHYNHTLKLYISGDIEYFGNEHIAYGVLAIVMLCTFIILPVIILALYPFCVFHKLAHLNILHTFVNSFQCCYKDGTEPGTRDCRWFASVFLIMRIVQFSLFFIADKNIFYSLVIMTLILHTTLIATVKPFKFSASHYTVINVVLLQCLTMLAITILVISFTNFLAPQFVTFFYIIGIIFGVIPFVYALATSSHWVYTHMKTPLDIMNRVRACRNGNNPLLVTELSCDDNALPHRIEHSEDYPRANLANFVSQQGARDH